MSAIPAAHIRSLALAAAGNRDSVVLHVTPSPFPPGCTDASSVPLRVTAISASQEPVTVAGNVQFTASTTGCDSGPVSYTWTFEPSHPGPGGATILDGGYQEWFYVPSGPYTSYAIVVTARHEDGSGPGYALERTVNVCLGGGGAALRADEPEAEPNAVEGCGGGGGGGGEEF